MGARLDQDGDGPEGRPGPVAIPPCDPATSGSGLGSDDVAKLAIANTDVPVMVTRPTGSGNPIVFVNEAFLRQTGYERADIVGADAAILNGPETDIARVIALRRRLQDGRSAVVELLTYRKDGTTWWNRVYATPIRGKDGLVELVVFLKTDVTEHYIYEEALRDAKEHAEVANRTKSEFMAILGHELRSPLNAVIGFSEVMMREQLGPLGSAQYKGYAKDIFDSARHLLDLINDLLDLSKAEAGRMELEKETVSLQDVLDGVLAMVRERARAKGIAVVISLPGGFPDLHADERKIKQVLLNLMTNAIKFTPDGGRVEVSARQVTEGLEIAISDTGIGIRPEDIPMVLSPYGQVRNQITRKEGTGLGLPLSKRLVELHDGRLIITSTPGQGTTVTIILPRACAVLR